MHHALEIQEVLLNIFSSGQTYYYYERADLAALARTCRAFKEPALDVLWSGLGDLSPLALCLPDVSYPVSRRNLQSRYAFIRVLNRAEWDTLRSYTRRIRSIRRFDLGLDLDSVRVRTFSTPSIPESLFPNLRHLQCKFKYGIRCQPLHPPGLPLLSLVSLDIVFVSVGALHYLNDCQCLKSFPEFSPNVTRLSVSGDLPKGVFGRNIFNYVCHWPNLQIVYCPKITLDVDALTHLSRMPALTQLTFTLSEALLDGITPSNSPLLFSNLHYLELSKSQSLARISGFLPHIQLPVITDLIVRAVGFPYKSVGLFLAAVQTACINRSIMRLELSQVPRDWLRDSHHAPILTFEDLRPSTAFSNLRHIDVNTKWIVCITEGELLELASAWPYLENLLINQGWGWKPEMSVGITPGGLFRLLQTCRSLNQICLAIDTRGYTEVPPMRSPASLGLDLPATFCINVVDSVIEAESVPAMSIFLAGVAPRADFDFHAWECWGAQRYPVYSHRWAEVYDRANEAIRLHCPSRDGSSSLSDAAPQS